MNHRLIEDENVAELYVTGRLSAQDEEDFESHLLECSDCRDRVAWADDLRTSMRAVAAEDAARATAQLGFLAWIARRTRTARAGLLMTALVAAAALPIWLQADRLRLARELDEAKARAEQAQRPVAPAPAPVAVPPADDSDDAEIEKLAQERSRLERELSASLAQEASLQDRLEKLTRPQINTALYSLGLVRGESDTNDVELGSSPEWIVLSLELSQVDHDTYRATLVDRDGKTVWQGSGLRPTGSDTLNILLYSADLKPGAAYRFRLEGLEEGGRAVPAGEIPFRVQG
jgi:hypothetical protein